MNQNDKEDLMARAMRKMQESKDNETPYSIDLSELDKHLLRMFNLHYGLQSTFPDFDLNNIANISEEIKNDVLIKINVILNIPEYNYPD